MLNYSYKVPQEHVDTMEVLREVLYRMAPLSESPTYLDLYKLRTSLFRPIINELKFSDKELYLIVERWLLRQITTDQAMEAFAKLDMEECTDGPSS